MESTYRAMAKIARVEQMYVARSARGEELSASAQACLRAVRKSPGMSQEALGAKLGIDKAAVTRMLRRLEAAGYVRRERSADDRRVNRLFATEKAAAYKMEAVTAQERFYEWLYECLTAEERRALDTILQKLYLRSKDERRAQFVHLKEREAAIHEKE